MTSNSTASNASICWAAGSEAWAPAAIGTVATARATITLQKRRYIGSSCPHEATLDDTDQAGGVQAGVVVLPIKVVVVLERVRQGQGAQGEARPQQLLVDEVVKHLAAESADGAFFASHQHAAGARQPAHQLFVERL